MALAARRRLDVAESRLRDLSMELEVARRRGPWGVAPAAAAPAASPPVAEAAPTIERPAGPEPAPQVEPAAPEAPATPEAPQPPAQEPIDVAPAAARPSLEERLGARWSVLVGGAALALGALLLVKYSFDAGLFGPGLRVLAGLALGAALIGAGERLRRREGEAAPQLVSIPAALTAAGTVAIFGALYAAHALYGFIGPTLAFLALGATGV
ncbi:MAG: DUF2339 domain-containing protein, partial [Methylobacteriaceae bacterium]|nr:DUF2339 domain-containing protein [Methylobacteriaceae bacterium]